MIPVTWMVGITCIVLLLIGLIYYFLTRIFNQLVPATNRLQKEVFLVQVYGSNLLGKGLLTAPYNYATSSQINDAIKTGLRAKVSSGDWILYTESDVTISNMLPYAMILTGTEFSNSDDINFIKTTQPTDVSATYWVCIYGYKPIPQYDRWWNLFALDQNFPILQANYHGVQAFNSTSWNAPQDSTAVLSGGNEIFWISIENYTPVSPADFSGQLVDGFKVGTTDQYFWSFANGLGDGWIQTAISASALDKTGVFQVFASNTAVQSRYGGLYQCTPCLNNPAYNTYKPGVVMYAIWGNKAKAVKNSNFLTGHNITVYDFNIAKVSQYD
uniref:Uncharacterized protein n=1 Tax=viral metagenome TaxID=1070528 RepID=A0A6C0JSH9_9ZZZZ